MNKLQKKLETGIYLWKEDGSCSAEGGDFENKLNFLSMNDAWYVLYMGNEGCDKDFDLTEEVKEGLYDMVKNLLREQKLHTAYFKMLTGFDPQGVQESFYGLKAFFEKLPKTDVQENETLKKLMKKLESQEDLEQLLNKIKNINRTKVNT